MLEAWSVAGGTLQGGPLLLLQVLDGRTDTKWLDFGGGKPGQTAWLEVRLQHISVNIQCV